MPVNQQDSDQRCTVGELRLLVEQFVSERKWQKFHNAKNLSMALAIEAGELMEHFQWLTTEEVVNGQSFDKQQVAEELADIASYTLALANALDIDVSSAVTEKMVKNRLKYPAP